MFLRSILCAAVVSLAAGCLLYVDEPKDRGPTPTDGVEDLQGFLDQGTLDIVIASNFQAIALDAVDGLDRALLWWTGNSGNTDADNGGTLEMGILSLNNGEFDAFSSYQRKQSTPVSVAVAGSRIFATWAESDSGRLMLMIRDTGGTIVTPATSVGEDAGVVPPRIAATGDGAIIVHAWSDDDSSLDPWITQIDSSGTVTAQEAVSRADGQTLSVQIAAAHDGGFAITYARDSRFYLRQYGPRGPTGEVFDIGETTWDYQTWSAIVESGGSVDHTLILGLPEAGSRTFADTRFARIPANAPGDLEITPTLGDTISSYEPPLNHVAVSTVAGRAAVTVVWQRILARDPDFAGCTEPPPTHSQLLIQRLAVDGAMARLGDTLLARDWNVDEGIPNPANAKVIVSSANSNQVAILWFEGTLRYRRFEL